MVLKRRRSGPQGVLQVHIHGGEWSQYSWPPVWKQDQEEEEPIRPPHDLVIEFAVIAVWIPVRKKEELKLPDYRFGLPFQRFIDPDKSFGQDRTGFYEVCIHCLFDGTLC